MNVLSMIEKFYPSAWDKAQVDALLLENKLSVDDYLTLFPVDEENPITEDKMELLRSAKMNEMRKACNNMIVSGIDVKTSNSGETTEHFSLDSYDQANITNMFYSVVAGVTEYPYHADGKECVTYTKEDIVAIYVAAQGVITYHTTYNNMMRVLINRTDDVNVLSALAYGMELPEDLNTQLQANIDTANAQTQNILNNLNA